MSPILVSFAENSPASSSASRSGRSRSVSSPKCSRNLSGVAKKARAEPSLEPELFLQLRIFLAQSIGQQLLQASILFLQREQTLQIAAVRCWCSGLFPLIVSLFGYAGPACGVLDAFAATDRLLDLSKQLPAFFFGVNPARFANCRGSVSCRRHWLGGCLSSGRSGCALAAFARGAFFFVTAASPVAGTSVGVCADSSSLGSAIRCSVRG